MIATDMSALLARKIIEGRKPDEIINRNGDAMFERWWLLRTPSGEDGGNIYLHRWLRSDREAPHCHPWWNKTSVLSGWIEEETWMGAAWLRSPPTRNRINAGYGMVRTAEQIHAIVACQPGTITLFETGKKIRDWGFYVDGQFVGWRDYHGLPIDWNKPAGCEVAA